MEIRSALQKIENYLTVVSNLNKTILSEGTMSRDELLLMKKYLYTSIDRIEDIERSLIIDKKEDKSFTPTPTSEHKIISTKQNEIVEVVENDLIENVAEDLGETLFNNKKEELQNIQTEILTTQTEIKAEEEYLSSIQQKIEEVPVAESTVTTNFAFNKTETFVENKSEEEVIGKLIVVEDITTKDGIFNKVETSVENDFEKIISETIPVIENNSAENYNLNDNTETILEKTTPTSAEVKEEDSLIETIVAKFEDDKLTTLVDELISNNKNETPFFEQFEQQLNTKSHSQFYQMFDDGKEALNENFATNKSLLEPINTGFDNLVNVNSYEQQDTILVAEKEVETINEQLTPSSLNDIFNATTTIENLTSSKATKTLSESIALNDKFIFVRELFGNQFGEYENALKYLDSLDSFSAIERYCNSTLWNKFNWTERASAAGRFMDLIEKRFK